MLRALARVLVLWVQRLMIELGVLTSMGADTPGARSP